MAGFKVDRNASREIARQPQFKARVRDEGERVKRHGEVLSPDGQSKHPGYRKRFKVTMPGNFARVSNTDIAAHLVEFGSVNNPPYAVLRRAARAAGLRLAEHGRTTSDV
jgi:hypothetical protein